ncbi:MAG: O-antigen ligase family protein [Pseudomonadota bacterium]|nr:O-antigen ligase family protein [Pseudomonadota bacterium]
MSQGRVASALGRLPWAHGMAPLRHRLVEAALGLAIGFGLSVQPTLTAVALVGIGVALLGVAYPAVLVALMFLGMLFDRLGVTGMKVSDFPVTASKLSVIASISLWGVRAAATRSRAVRWHPVLTSMVVVVAVTGICIAAANSLTLGRFNLYGLAMMTVLVALVYAALAEIQLQPLYRFLALALSAALLASLWRSGGVGEAARASGTMGDPNEWASTVLLLTPFVLGGLADDPSRLARPLRLALVVLAPLSILLSASRAALLVTLVVGPASIYLLRRHRGELAACGITAAVAAPLVVDLDTALVRFRLLLANLQGGAKTPDQSFEERSELLRQGLDLFREHWFIGAGPGRFASATGFVSHTGRLRPAHNTYLEIASEQGVVGLLAMGIFVVSVAMALRRAYLDTRSPRDRNRLLGVAFGLFALGLMAATLGLLTFSMAYLVLGFGLAVIYQAGRPVGGAATRASNGPHVLGR